jgi:rhodanese-related sulfurtransferase
MKILSYDQLKKMKDAKEAFVLINVLPAEAFNEAHIPDSINIPLKQADFVAQVEKAAGGKDKAVVTYCAGFECPASHDAAEKLEKSGFTKVSAYEGGTKEWLEKSGKRQAAA